MTSALSFSLSWSLVSSCICRVSTCSLKASLTDLNGSQPCSSRSWAFDKRSCRIMILSVYSFVSDMYDFSLWSNSIYKFEISYLMTSASLLKSSSHSWMVETRKIDIFLKSLISFSEAFPFDSKKSIIWVDCVSINHFSSSRVLTHWS